MAAPSGAEAHHHSPISPLGGGGGTPGSAGGSTGSSGGGSPASGGSGIGHMCIVISQPGSMTDSQMDGIIISSFGPSKSYWPSATCGPKSTTWRKASLIRYSIP